MARLNLQANCNGSSIELTIGQPEFCNTAVLSIGPNLIAPRVGLETFGVDVIPVIGHAPHVSHSHVELPMEQSHADMVSSPLGGVGQVRTWAATQVRGATPVTRIIALTVTDERNGVSESRKLREDSTRR